MTIDTGEATRMPKSHHGKLQWSSGPVIVVGVTRPSLVRRPDGRRSQEAW